MAKPLIKLSGDGTHYVRPPAVENNIDGAIAQGWSDLERRLAQTETSSPEYLRSECLIHLFREFHHRGACKQRDAVVEIILKRCEHILLSKIDSTIVRNAEDLRENILQEMATLLAEDQPGDLDFFECKFNKAFLALRVDVMRKEYNATHYFEPLPDESTPDNDDDFQRPTAGIPVSRPQQEGVLVRKELLSALRPNVRKAVILCYEFGYKIASSDSSEVTAATLCGVTGRTIQNWLNEAKEQLREKQEHI